MTSRHYKFIVEPLDDFTNEAIAADLARRGQSGGSEYAFEFQGEPKEGYIVLHSFIMKLKKKRDPRFKYELFEQEGGGNVRKYGIPDKKRSRKVRRAKEVLEEIKKKREEK